MPATTPTPLAALVWVFGITAGLTLLLLLTTMALAALHRQHRRNGRYTEDLKAVRRELTGSSDLGRSARVLTTGDLVMDAAARELVMDIARLRNRRPPNSPSHGSAPPAG